MSDPLIRACDDYLVIEPGKPEKLLNASETQTWLISWLKQIQELPEDLKKQPSLNAAAKYLLDTACDLEIKPGVSLQWFAVRLNPPVS